MHAHPRGGRNLPGRAHLGLPILELRTARDGRPTALLAGVWLHSRYDPAQEARRFARSGRPSADAPPPSTVILLGGELGHVCTALAQEFAGARLLVIYYDSTLFAHAGPSLPGRACAWHPGSPEGLLQFLRAQIGEIDAQGLKVLEWEPSARACPRAAFEANRLVGQFLRELRGSLVTTAAVGRRWLRNSFYNYVALDDVRPMPRFPQTAPVVIAASGPSLAASLPLIRRHRRRLLLWALPSAVSALCAAELSPDLVVLTDPGYYAVRHLHGALPRGTALCMPLSAGTGAWRLQAAVSYFSQDTSFEREILTTLEGDFPVVLPSGTVCASALELAFQTTSGPIVLAGLDFLFDDLHSHVRPNTVECILSAGQSRLSPLHHRLFDHATQAAPRRKGQPGDGSTPAGAHSNLALDTYAGWFAEIAAPPGRSLYRLFPSSVPLPGMQPLAESSFREILPASTAPAPAPRPAPAGQPYPPRKQRRRAALLIIEGWIAELAAAALGGQPQALRSLIDSPRLTGLLYHCDAPRMAELRRRLRLQGAQAASAAAGRLIAETRDFLTELAARIAQAA